MSGDNLIPGSDDWQQHAHDELFGPHSILPYYNCEPGLGGSGIPTPDQFTNANQLVLAQESAGGYGYLGNQSFVWDYAAHSSQHGELVPPAAQTQAEVYPGSMAITHDGLWPETPPGSEASPGHVTVSVETIRKEKARLSTAKCRQRAKGKIEALLAREAELRSENEKLEAIKIDLEGKKLSLTQEVFSHSQCGDDNIQRFIQSRACKVAGGGGGC
ncbi:hypothetical protein PG993_008645 [Apiospora rasikravindrae]